MKILLVGEWLYEMYEKAISDALLKLDHEVIPFKWHPYFKVNSSVVGFKTFETIYKKAQNKYLYGPLINKLNDDLLKVVHDQKPDVVFLFRGTHIKGSTLKKLKADFPKIVLIIYNHDDPFSPDYPMWKPWRHFMDSISYSDLVLAHRHRNFKDFSERGAKKIKLLRTWFIPERNHPVELSSEEKKKFECDVVFVGHYEHDGRLQYLEALANAGIDLKIHGGNNEWGPALKDSEKLKHLLPTKHAWGEDYNKAIAGGKIALCFFSKLNRDTYATRCFEIPATGSMLLSEYTEDAASLYEAGKSADFFKTPEELVEKVKMYLSNEELRKQVAHNGHLKVSVDGHDVVSRMKNVVSWIEECQKEF
jgi:spore maturation protein CgeB